MLPAVILACVGLVLMVVVFVLFLILSIVASAWIKDAIKRSGGSGGDADFESSYSIVVVILLIVFAIIAGLCLYSR